MKTTNVFLTDAWRVAQEPEAIAEAITIGEQITELLTEATTLTDRACRDVDSIITSAILRFHVITERLIGETDRLTPILARLRAANKAVN